MADAAREADGDAVDAPDSGSDRVKAGKLGLNYWKLWTASVVSNLGDGVAMIAYPWLASAVTRNPVMIASIAIAQRLPWLIFALPAGVITDRVDRRKIMTSTAVFRTFLTLAVAVVVFLNQDVLPSPEDIAGGAAVRSNLTVYLTPVISALPIGFAIGGIVVSVSEAAGLDRAMALRMPYFLTAAALGVVFVWAAPQLTTEKIETARRQGIAAKSAASGQPPADS